METSTKFLPGPHASWVHAQGRKALVQEAVNANTAAIYELFNGMLDHACIPVGTLEWRLRVALNELNNLRHQYGVSLDKREVETS